MPTYAYACTACDEQIEVVQRFTDAPLTDCPSCTGALRKVFHPVGIVFKGSGFYKTDARSSRSSARSSTGSSGSTESAPSSSPSGDTSGTSPADSSSGSTSGPSSESSSGSSSGAAAPSKAAS